MTSPRYYPVFLNLKGKKCVVVGGGRVAERKVLSLLESGADITVISPELTKRLRKESVKSLNRAKGSKGNLRHISREYKKGDIRNAFLAIAATDSMETNKKVSADAPNLINVVDAPSLCNFIAPSVVRRGPLTIAISTSGVSPSIAKAIRKELEKLYGPKFGRRLDSIKKIRTKALSEIKDKKKRERFLKKLGAEAIKRI
ncbi:MAG: bifunctional precorrin-2 dehydrogenase/sirohydrochlorin ferrochelatase [Nitrospirae bacterium]|nr:MAG: bifunctional precorrin-2 dehydrogenase/sirohydrochlorin ferrochelatase [Nitrospirota bacterium]